jgi:hypothetical protein
MSESDDGAESDDWEMPPPEGGVLELFGGERLTTGSDVLEQARKEHGFDFTQKKKELGLDFYGVVRLVNHLRKEVHQALQEHGVAGEGKSLAEPERETEPEFGSATFLFAVPKMGLQEKSSATDLLGDKTVLPAPHIARIKDSVRAGAAWLTDDSLMTPFLPGDALLYEVQQLDDDEEWSDDGDEGGEEDQRMGLSGCSGFGAGGADAAGGGAGGQQDASSEKGKSAAAAASESAKPPAAAAAAGAAAVRPPAAPSPAQLSAPRAPEPPPPAAAGGTGSLAAGVAALEAEVECAIV